MLKKIIKIITATIYVFLIGAAIYYARTFTIENILSFSPSDKILAALFIMGLYALKSISVFFPIIILQIVSGFLFPAPVALIINLAGAIIDFTLPYYIGLFCGAAAAEKKIKQNPKINNLIEKQRNHEFFLTFFLRVISCLPSDLVSMYLGMLKFKFMRYLTASMLGALPGIIPATFMGQSIREPFSAEFITAGLITIICSLVSILLFYIYNKKHNNAL